MTETATAINLQIHANSFSDRLIVEYAYGLELSDTMHGAPKGDRCIDWLGEFKHPPINIFWKSVYK